MFVCVGLIKICVILLFYHFKWKTNWFFFSYRICLLPCWNTFSIIVYNLSNKKNVSNRVVGWEWTRKKQAFDAALVARHAQWCYRLWLCHMDPADLPPHTFFVLHNILHFEKMNCMHHSKDCMLKMKQFHS